jgi:hypothetical protein
MTLFALHCSGNFIFHIDWQNRSHFFAVSAHTVRQILVDHARARNAGKRGAEWN